MSKNKKRSIRSGVSTLSLLGVAFVVLKLTNVINWSWWWVTLPFWGGAALGLLYLLIILGIFLFVLLAAIILNK